MKSSKEAENELRELIPAGITDLKVGQAPIEKKFMDSITVSVNRESS